MRVALAVLFVTSLVRGAAAAPCESLTTLALPQSAITSAQMIAPGSFTPPSSGREGGGRGAKFKDLPSFCRVVATLTPTSDSEIKVEVWLPASGWNGKVEAVQRRLGREY